MKNNKAKLLAVAVAMGISAQASAAITIYDQDQTTFSVDGMFNTFYVQSNVDITEGGTLDGLGMRDRDQSRVKMGFLPNWIGFNFGKQINDMKVGGRSSFWVTINDSDVHRGGGLGNGHLGTQSGIDVRQFYGTIDADWGQILIGKDFGLFGRSTILGDELLLGFGQTSDALGLVDGGNVSFGNIGTGYLYPFPKSQITYRSPVNGGFQAAVGIMDPNKSEAGSEESAPRLEAELTYSTDFDGGSVKAWLGGMTQSSDSADGSSEVDSNGVAGGINVKAAGFSLTASAFDAEGVASAAGIDQFITSEANETEGYLLQASYTAGANRFVLSYGESESASDPLFSEDTEMENTGIAIFHTVNDNLKLVAEYNRTEVTIDGDSEEETDTIALGAVLTF